jgi:rhodanese-related sulfurtransferase
MFVKDVAIISCLLLLGLAHAQQRELTPEQFLDGNQKGLFSVIVDVRTQSEWNAGHIENATLVENLASTGSPELLLGCENCNIVVYWTP